MQYGFYFDNTRCTGCKTCEMACKDYYDLGTDRTYRRVIDYEGGQWEAGESGTYTHSVYAYHISLSCNHCNNAACIQVCPTGAMHKDDQGLVWPDWRKCIGCGYCTMACPYHAPIIDQKAKKSSKCDGCRERIAQGKEAICVEACPLRALEFRSITAIEKDYPGCGSQIMPLPDYAYTLPNLVIKSSPAAQKALSEKGHIANRGELQIGGDFDK